MLKAHETQLEIDLSALTHNYNYIKSKLKTGTKVLGVIKAFAYGSDSVEIAKHLEKLDVDYFAVAYTQEGVALRDAGVKKPILVLHSQSVNFKTIIERCLEPSIYSDYVLKEFIKTAESLSQNNYPVHLKFNTGLNRLGFSEDEIGDVVSKLENTSAIEVKSMFSHLAASEDPNEEEFTKLQISRFKTIAKKFETQAGYKPWLHLCNTSGIINYPEAHLDMVRCGIGLYGYGNSVEEDQKLKPIATLKSIVSQIHQIKKGESVGYNRAYKAKGDEKTATIPLGHADGLNRIYGKGKGYVTINGKKAFILGNVCMDMVMVDITDINCKEGDEVIIFGPKHSANDLAESANSISYEILTSISQRIPRIFKNE